MTLVESVIDDSAHAARLGAFLDAYRGVSRATQAPAQRGAVVSAARLSAVLKKLAPLQETARRAGAAMNVWAAAGLGHDEVRTSAVLAWFLDPEASHGAGDLFAQALWRAAGGADLGFDLTGLRRAATEVCPLADLSDRVDVVLNGDDFVVHVEVKIFAGLQPDQLQRYATAARRAALLREKAHFGVIYLAPHATQLPKEGRWLSWRQLARAFREAAGGLDAPLVAGAAAQFADHIETLGTRR